MNPHITLQEILSAFHLIDSVPDRTIKTVEDDE